MVDQHLALLAPAAQLVLAGPLLPARREIERGGEQHERRGAPRAERGPQRRRVAAQARPEQHDSFAAQKGVDVLERTRDRQIAERGVVEVGYLQPRTALREPVAYEATLGRIRAAREPVQPDVAHRRSKQRIAGVRKRVPW